MQDETVDAMCGCAEVELCVSCALEKDQGIKLL